MQAEQNKSRYSRQIMLHNIGEAGQDKLRKARVLIVGVGGLGCPAAQYLAGAGIGVLGLMDADLVDSGNLHRQIVFTEADIGKPKALVAKDRLLQLNSELRIETYVELLNPANALSVISDYDIVLDATDNFQSKYLINDACLKAAKPWVYASVHKYQGQLSVFNYQMGPSLRCAFPQAGGRDISCEETGVLGVLPGILGIQQAAEVLKMILEIGEVLSGKLKLIDILNPSENYLNIRRNEKGIEKVMQNELAELENYCEFRVRERIYLDVREAYEMPRPLGEGILTIPIDQLRDRYPDIPRSEEVYVFCQSGIRSRMAIDLLEKEFGFGNLKNVEGGIQTLTL